MNLKHAGYIMAILEAGSITAAAKRLHISQPSLSQTVKAVEEDLGAPIFDRTKRGFALTWAGEKYLESMREIMTIEKNLFNEISEMKNEHRVTLRIGISTQRSIVMLPQVLPEFMGKYPHAAIELKELPSARLEDLLIKGGCDAAFITTSSKQNGIEYQLLENEQIVLMASRRTQIARRVPHGTEIELGEARDEAFINLTPGHSVRIIQDHLAQLSHMQPRVLMELFNMEAAKLITAQLNAVMVCPYGYIQDDSRVEKLIKCYPLNCHGFERHFYFCYPKKLRLSACLRDLYEIARSKCRHHTMHEAFKPFADLLNIGYTGE